MRQETELDLEEAAKEYEEGIVFRGLTKDVCSIQNAFKEGVKWYKGNLWHSTDEIPSIGVSILVQIDDKYMSWTTTGFIADTFKRLKIKRWCYVEDFSND